ncbi:urea transporter [Pseudomonas sp. SJZ101]|nr:urea transporter [Pseudomonas sp. SJZ075]TWC29883.1 urea transporter [Pseudomonas sp. SJZ078]TWC50864.1 urea transporter [Pseudomonas sp. SJZ124]TWC86311.1 urea transporter [Pseudomonas sp. SJZ101]
MLAKGLTRFIRYTNMQNSPCPDWATALLNGFSQIFLQRHPLCGLLCLLAILFSAPALFGWALLGGVAGLLTAQRRDYPKADRQAGLFSYNGILLGLLAGLVLPWSVLLPPLIIAGGGLSAMLTQQWLKRTRDPRCLPAYTAPFVGLGWLLLSFAAPQPSLMSAELTLANLLAGCLTGLGQVMFLGHPLAGALITAGLLVANRRAAGWALFGSAAGVAFAWCIRNTQRRCPDWAVITRRWWRWPSVNSAANPGCCWPESCWQSCSRRGLPPSVWRHSPRRSSSLAGWCRPRRERGGRS